ncbi:FAD-binding protein [Desulfocurvus vexinensis]|uniref:FAD-binding protein n=1 Tax=Desulfocurvus vexinensis TaxID=399548 RepID=UPI0004B5D0BE|nr:FAD-binding protein [Desulfocurvus vexinensis]
MPDQPLRCDVLVLGAGLAGLRAAWAAAEAAPGARVLLAAPLAGPSGSALANVNARLGVLAPPADAQREALAARILALAAPGRADPALVAALLEDAPARVAELAALGVPMERTQGGALRLHPACFAQDHACAALLTELPRAHALLAARARALGAATLPGLAATRLLAGPDGAACGALLTRLADGAPVAVAARAVVAALGGPAGLFGATLAGPGSLGLGPGLLDGTGAALAHCGCVQFFWSEVPGGAFFRVHTLAAPGAGLRGPGGAVRPLPPELAAHAAARATHCPASWGLPDAALDRFLAARLDEAGTLAVALADGRATRIAPWAHSGNGGALVNPHGATTVPGLFAAGECATGMHGADRVGGAMVAAALVFGARAGARAARHALAAAPLPDKMFTDLMNNPREKPAPGARTARPAAAPLPADAPGALLTGDTHYIEIIKQNTLIALMESPSPLEEAALRSALTVVRDLHTID